MTEELLDRLTFAYRRRERTMANVYCAGCSGSRVGRVYASPLGVILVTEYRQKNARAEIANAKQFQQDRVRWGQSESVVVPYPTVSIVTAVGWGGDQSAVLSDPPEFATDPGPEAYRLAPGPMASCRKGCGDPSIDLDEVARQSAGHRAKKKPVRLLFSPATGDR